jgi:ABC-2 type transport system ATP-binding protein
MLEVRGLTKCYTRLPAVDAVSFAVQPGEVTAYLGPNGSGKTTTMKMLVGLLEPTHGSILYKGREVRADLLSFKRRLGYVPEEPYLYPYLSGWDYLLLVGGLRGIPENLLEEKAERLLDLFSLRRQRHALSSSYSRGMKQKILISAALLHDPEVLIFDEPLSGLDVNTAMVFRNLLKLLAGEGKTILYSSHVLEVVERVASRVIILHKGRVVADDSVERLRELTKVPTLEGIFSQLVMQDDTEAAARRMVEAMKLSS